MKLIRCCFLFLFLVPLTVHAQTKSIEASSKTYTIVIHVSAPLVFHNGGTCSSWWSPVHGDQDL
jgi:hypothetical protein